MLPPPPLALLAPENYSNYPRLILRPSHKHHRDLTFLSRPGHKPRRRFDNPPGPAMWDLVAGTEGNANPASSSMADVLSNFTWEPQPDHRGTFGIVTSCFVTLALCTWKIVHLNLPGACPDAGLPWTAWWKKGTTRSVKHRLVHILGGHQITRQIGWLLIGLLAPELVSFALLL